MRCKQDDEKSVRRLLCNCIGIYFRPGVRFVCIVAFMGRIILRIAFPPLLLLAASVQCRGQLTLQCGRLLMAQSDLAITVESRSPAEFYRMRHSPHGAARTIRHVLWVGWAGNRRAFADNPPHDEIPETAAWTYCGYSAAVNFHLIEKKVPGLLTGVLMDDSSGSLLPGGHVVMFSPDRQSYAAFDQEDGQDLEAIKLYNRSGTLLWKGYCGLFSEDGRSVEASFDNVRWDDSGRLIAEYKAPQKAGAVLFLSRGPDAIWRWLPDTRK